MLGRNSRREEVFKSIKINGGKRYDATDLLSKQFNLQVQGVRTGGI